MFDPPPEWWDPYSCQPYKLERGDKPRNSPRQLFEYGKVAASALVGLLPVTYRYLRLKPEASGASPDEFIGLSVSPEPEYDDVLPMLVDELGIRNLLVRVPCWEAERIDDYLQWMQAFKNCRFVVNVLQSRDSVRDIDSWRRQLDRISSALVDAGQVEAVWIANAINRTKWGCRDTGDYLRLQEAAGPAASLLRERGKTVLGSSIIDFEPLPAWRTLFNFADYDLDATAAQLYVNRRHSPWNTQYGTFDLRNKLRLFKAMTQAGNRSADRLWITETNWPLLDTKPYTPNSGHPSRTVDEPTQADYLKLYYQIAWHSGWVDRVYWWQLINPGYGLIDSRGGSLRKMPSFYAMRDLVCDGFGPPPDQSEQ